MLHFPEAGKGVFITTVPYPAWLIAPEACLVLSRHYLLDLLRTVRTALHYAGVKVSEGIRVAARPWPSSDSKALALSPLFCSLHLFTKKVNKFLKSKNNRILFFSYHIWQHFLK